VIGTLVVVVGAALAYLRSNPELQQQLGIDLSVLGTAEPALTETQVANAPSTGGSEASNNGLPDVSFKQERKEITFNECPPQGDGGDPELNLRKNRVDDGNWQPTAFSAMMSLTWPQEIERKDHDTWSQADAQAIDQYEGLPVQVEGYLLDAVKSGPESTNCHSETDTDHHVWMLDQPGGHDDRAGSLVIETTPRVAANHPNWETKNLTYLARNSIKVRISGWTFFDPEHPDQIGKTRGTIWEIHPVMKIEAWIDNAWVNIDDMNF
jgi:hypothetical protein